MLEGLPKKVKRWDLVNLFWYFFECYKVNLEVYILYSLLFDLNRRVRLKRYTALWGVTAVFGKMLPNVPNQYSTFLGNHFRAITNLEVHPKVLIFLHFVISCTHYNYICHIWSTVYLSLGGLFGWTHRVTHQSPGCYSPAAPADHRPAGDWGRWRPPRRWRSSDEGLPGEWLWEKAGEEAYGWYGYGWRKPGGIESIELEISMDKNWRDSCFTLLWASETSKETRKMAKSSWSKFTPAVVLFTQPLPAKSSPFLS